MVQIVFLFVSQQFYLVKVTQIALVGNAFPDRLLYGGMLPVHTVDAKEHIESVDYILHEREAQFVFL